MLSLFEGLGGTACFVADLIAAAAAAFRSLKSDFGR
jgi:hypothetical protein